jgi:hypothetical protein
LISTAAFPLVISAPFPFIALAFALALSLALSLHASEHYQNKYIVMTFPARDIFPFVRFSP